MNKQEKPQPRADETHWFGLDLGIERTAAVIAAMDRLPPDLGYLGDGPESIHDPHGVIIFAPPAPLTAAMDNATASRLGQIALDAGNPSRKGVGDSIDRGLILRRLLEEKGFAVCQILTAEPHATS